MAGTSFLGGKVLRPADRVKVDCRSVVQVTGVRAGSKESVSDRIEFHDSNFYSAKKIA